MEDHEIHNGSPWVPSAAAGQSIETCTVNVISADLKVRQRPGHIERHIHIAAHRDLHVSLDAIVIYIATSPATYDYAASSP